MFFQFELLQSGKGRVKGIPQKIQLRPNSTDLAVFREIFLFKSYEISLDKTPEIIIDGGGNIGLSGVYFANKFPGCKIYSFEPDHDNFQVLCKNVKPYEWITPVQAALWHKDSYIRIVNKNVHQWAFEVEESSPTDSEAILGVSITTVMKKYSFQHIDLLKLDIEGSEKELFSEHFQAWIPFTKYILVELHDWLRPGASKAVFKAIAENDFDVTLVNGMLLMRNKAFH